jgi:arylsulfatase
MNLHRLGFWLIILPAGFLSGCQADEPAAESAAAAKPPNILLIVADDLGYTDIGAFGSEIPTPNLDELAFAGIRLSGFHTGRACQQTRAMLMASAGTTESIEVRPRLPDGTRDNLLRLEWAIIPELLQEAGYATYMVGKWDLGMDEAYRPSVRGFDRSFALLEGGGSHFREYFWREGIFMEDEGRRLVLDDLPDDFYSTRFYTDRMLEYLESGADEQPWFGYLAYTAPHWPLQVPDDWLDRHAGRYELGYDELRAERLDRAAALDVLPDGADAASYQPVAEPWNDLAEAQRTRYARAQEIYASMVEYMDVDIGRIVDYLETSGQLENTVIVFMADHGASAGEHGVGEGGMRFDIEDTRDNRLENFGKVGSFVDKGTGFAEASSAPFRYFKASLYEGGLRAAAFVRGPGIRPAGGVDHTFVSVLDVLPTFLDIAGLEHPGAGDFRGRRIRAIRGQSFWPRLTGDIAADDRSAYEIGWTAGDSGALVRGRYKVISHPLPRSTGVTPWRLFDIEADPSETRDLAGDLPEVVDALVGRWESDWK